MFQDSTVQSSQSSNFALHIVSHEEVPTDNASPLLQDTRVQLSPTERRILEFFICNPDKYFSAADVFETVWDGHANSSSKTVKVHINAIRRKLSFIGAEDLISTVRGSGYILRLHSVGFRKNPNYRVVIYADASDLENRNSEKQEDSLPAIPELGVSNELPTT